MSLSERELDDLLARTGARHWFEEPKTASLVARLRATGNNRRWSVWLLAPLLAACAGASYAAVRHACDRMPVHIRLEHRGETLDAGTHILVLDERGPQPVVVDLPDHGEVEFKVELPADMPPERLRNARLEVLFTTDPGK